MVEGEEVVWGVDGDGEGWEREGGMAVCAGVQRGCDDEERVSVVVGNRVVCHGPHA